MVLSVYHIDSDGSSKDGYRPLKEYGLGYSPAKNGPTPSKLIGQITLYLTPKSN